VERVTPWPLVLRPLFEPERCPIDLAIGGRVTSEVSSLSFLNLDSSIAPEER